MVFRLEAGEMLAAGLGRVAAEEIHRARGALLSEGDPEAEVLEARKSLKKVRAILRLSRVPLGKRRFRSQNRRYRDLARRLAEQRAGAVGFKTLEGLAQGMDGSAPLPVLRASRRRLATRRRRHDDAAVRAEVAKALTGAAPGLEALPLEGFEAVRLGLARTYRKGRKQMRRAREAPSAEAFHEWRKRVKDLWYQVRFFGRAWPQALGSLADELHHLSDHLGSGHDLDVLESALQEEARVDPHFDPSPLLMDLAKARAAKRAAALELGRRLYAEDPEEFVTRVEAYWRAWRESETPVA
ncbi:MAG TPA: CHAD domain-containing protein [Gemmatimonadota bacterium]|nr:CHAD domain-containing protein [Gemmatimonadota bacterium]